MLFLLNRTESTHSQLGWGHASERSGQECSLDADGRDTSRQSCCWAGDDKPAFGSFAEPSRKLMATMAGGFHIGI